MRRLLTASALAALLLTLMTTPLPAEASLGTADGELSTAQSDETVTPGEESTSVPSEDPAGGDGPARFDSLWLVIVGVVGLLLLIGIVRAQRGWDSSSRPSEEQPGNEDGSRDVLGHE
jgi:hypothetical protein